MKKIVLLLLIPFILLANTHVPIDERVTDIYFANGIMNSQDDADDSLNLIKKEIQIKLYNGDKDEMLLHHNFDTAYNESYGMGLDLFESFLQLIAQSPTATSLWSAFKTYVGSQTKIDFIDLIEDWVTNAKNADLSTQITSYTNSIEAGHGVIVVAHSQGNLFTNEAYDKLAPWMQNYFNIINVASPTSTVAGGGDIISWDNDGVGQIAQGNINYIPNPIRQVEWIDLGGKISRMPYSNYIFDNQVGSIYDNRFKSEENLLNRLDTNVHAFPYYMGEPLKYDGNAEVPHGMTNSKPLTTDVTKIEISARLLSAITSHKTTPSQWIKSSEFACGCDKRINVVHEYDPSLDGLMKGVEIVEFDEFGKLYPIDSDYYKGSTEGVSIKKYDAGNVCMDLLDDKNNKIDEFLEQVGQQNITNGAVEVTLSWENGADYDLDLDMPSSIRDVQSCSMEHAYVESEFQIYPEKYAVNVQNVSQKDVNGTYSLTIKAPGTTEVFLMDANETGHIADIHVKYVDDKPVFVLQPTTTAKIIFSGGTSSSGGGGFSTRTSSSSSSSSSSGSGSYSNYTSTTGYSCGHIPCEYWITQYVSQALTGPLSGADIALYTLDDFKTKTSLYSGKTSTGNTIYTAGKLDIPQETISALDDETLYIIEVSGGLDIDADDNMEVDLVPTTNLGTLHAIITAKELKELKPKVNILTEVAYQVLKESLANTTQTKDEIVSKLNDIASRLLLAKVYTNSKEELGYVDLLEWLPTTDQALLHASYEDRVVPIVESLLQGGDIYQSAYNLVYVPDGVVPILESKIYLVSEDDVVGTTVGHIVVQYEGTSTIQSIDLYGEGSDNFSVDSAGVIKLVSLVDYEKQQLYSLFVRAKNADGFSKYTTIYIEVKDVVDAPYATSFIFENIYANVAIGTKVGQIIFESGSSQITSMNLSREDSSYFSVDNNGSIITSKSLEDFFVKKAYLFDVVAINDSGESSPVSIILNIGDRRDIPQIDSIYTYIDENVIEGSVLGRVNVVHNGDSPIISYALSDTTQFVIDDNGTITVAPDAILDYETQHEISLSVIASNIIGDSRPKDVVVRLNNIPDVVPTLSDVNISINKETAAEITIVNILENAGDTKISSFTLSPNSEFGVDLNGNIFLKASLLNQNIESFTLQASATNGFGKSEIANVNISLIVIPVINDFVATTYDNTSQTTKIGRLSIAKNGNAIETITLSGEGSGDFSVDLSGNISVANGITLKASRQDYYSFGVSVNGVYDATITINVLNRIIGSVDTPDSAQGVSLSADGTKVFVADGYSGLQIIDISDPTAPVIIGSVDTPSGAMGVTLSTDGTKVFVADGYSGLQIIDISDPIAPVIIGSVDTPNYAQGVTLSTDGTKVFVADGSSGLQIVDISDSTAPVIISSVDTPSQAQGVNLSADGTKAFVADDYSGLQIIDISDPASSFIIGSVDTPGYARGVSLSTDGTKAFVADDRSGLQIIDISDPKAPVIIGSVDTSGRARGVSLSTDGTKAFVADNYSGLQIVDISDPTAPVIIGSVDTPGYAYGVTLSTDGTKAFMADYASGLQIIDITGFELAQKVPGIAGFSTILEGNSAVGSIVGEVTVYYSGESGISSFRLEGDRADDFSIDINGVVRLEKELKYFVNNVYALKVIATNDIGQREVNVNIHIHSLPEVQDFTASVNSMSAEGTYVGKLDIFLGDNNTITDIYLSGEGSEKFTVNVLGEISVATQVELHHFVKAEYNLNLNATNSYGNSESNVTIAVSGIMSSVDTPNYTNGVTLSTDGTKAFVADDYSGLQIVDISDPTAPVIIGSVDTSGRAMGVTLSVDGTKVFVADYTSGLQIIDISDPTAPVIIGSVDTPSYAMGVSLSTDGTKAFVADDFSGLQIVDISDPTAPVIIGSVDTSGRAMGVTLSVDGTKVFVADYTSGLQIIDISDPTAPVIIGSVDTPSGAMGVTLSTDGTKVFVADGYSGLQIIDISDPIAPVIIGSVDTPNYAQGVTLSTDGTKVFVADSYSGLQIVDISDPTAPVIIGSVDTPDIAYGVSLSIDGTKAFVSDYTSGLQIIDLTGL